MPPKVPPDRACCRCNNQMDFIVPCRTAANAGPLQHKPIPLHAYRVASHFFPLATLSRTKSWPTLSALALEIPLQTLRQTLRRPQNRAVGAPLALVLDVVEVCLPNMTATALPRQLATRIDILVRQAYAPTFASYPLRIFNRQALLIDAAACAPTPSQNMPAFTAHSWPSLQRNR